MSAENQNAARTPVGQLMSLALAVFLVVVSVAAAVLCAVSAAFLLLRLIPGFPLPPDLDILYFEAVKWLVIGFAVGVPACILAVHTTSLAPTANRWASGRRIAVVASVVLGVSCGAVFAVYTVLLLIVFLVPA